METIREQNEQIEIDKLFPRIYKMMDDIRKVFKELEIKHPEKCNNIAILLNNKIVEIGQEYKSKDIGFYSESKLKNTILLKLISYYDMGYKKINEFAESDNDESIKTVNEAIEYLEQGARCVGIYNLACKELYKYSIKDNIVNNIISEYESYPDKKKYLSKIAEYKKELKALGYDEQITELENEISKFNKKEENEEER